jgi:hypothetical protein
MPPNVADDQAGAKLAPWVRHPRGLVSLWDMISLNFRNVLDCHAALRDLEWKVAARNERPFKDPRMGEDRHAARQATRDDLRSRFCRAAHSKTKKTQDNGGRICHQAR